MASEGIYYRTELALVQSLITLCNVHLHFDQTGLVEQRWNRQIDPLMPLDIDFSSVLGNGSLAVTPTLRGSSSNQSDWVEILLQVLGLLLLFR